MSQEMQAALEAINGEEMDSPLEPAGEMQP
jgi:hypothetical protein